MTDANDNKTADLLYGMRKISAYLNVTPSVGYHLAATNQIPTFKMNKTVCAKRSAIDRALEAAEEAGR
jgi:hypothetical protein